MVPEETENRDAASASCHSRHEKVRIGREDVFHGDANDAERSLLWQVLIAQVTQGGKERIDVKLPPIQLPRSTAAHFEPSLRPAGLFLRHPNGLVGRDVLPFEADLHRIRHRHLHAPPEERKGVSAQLLQLWRVLRPAAPALQQRHQQDAGEILGAGGSFEAVAARGDRAHIVVKALALLGDRRQPVLRVLRRRETRQPSALVKRRLIQLLRRRCGVGDGAQLVWKAAHREADAGLVRRLEARRERH
mmetsp:Transcript_6013/g.23357  ORF Transcript_6013/g.23357 Transcript_6013/m.23357 type:complete len:247 (-) Transcript_6013:201-941(-)